MISVQELRAWTSGLDTAGFVGIDDGGLTLVAVGDHEPDHGPFLETGGCPDDIDRARRPSSTHVRSASVSAHAAAAVISVADLLAMVGGSLTHTELPALRRALRASSIGETLGDVVYSIITRGRDRLTAQLRPFTAADAFTGQLGRGALASVPGERIGRLFAGIEQVSGLSLIRVCCGDAAPLCVHDRAAGRLFDVAHTVQMWLHGDHPTGPGPTGQWIGDPVDDFTLDELTPTGPHDYTLPELPPHTD